MKRTEFFKTHAVAFTAIIFSLAVMSFRAVESKSADTVYTYNSANTSEGSFANPANWMVVSSPASCLSTGNRPCNITVPSGSTLSAQIGGLTNTQVLAIHPTQRKP